MDSECPFWCLDCDFLKKKHEYYNFVNEISRLIGQNYSKWLAYICISRIFFFVTFHPEKLLGLWISFLQELAGVQG